VAAAKCYDSGALLKNLKVYRKGLLAVVGLGLSATLELLDFPPILWTFDRKGAQLVHASYENKKLYVRYLTFIF
jgi:hypothetical protein